MILDTVRYETDVDYDVVTVAQWHEIEDLIRQLDGDTRTDLMVSSSQEGLRRIIVMGGGEYYVVSAHLSEGVFLLERPDQPKEEFVELVLGGNSADVPKALAVSLPEVLQAVRTFCCNGELDSDLHWHCRRGPRGC